MRSIGRDRARRRMLSDVPNSTLIIANPTHFSVALRYDKTKDAAPLVVAKGQDLIALKIREIGAANNVPVFEQVELARGLYKSVKVGQTIPPVFYQAVAELIRTIYNVKPRSA
jgi:flagellar biosynthesis protein FlhB